MQILVLFSSEYFASILLFVHGAVKFDGLKIQGILNRSSRLVFMTITPNSASRGESIKTEWDDHFGNGHALVLF